MVGLGRAGVGRAGPNTWRAVAQPCHGRGLLLGFIRSTAHTVWLTVDQRSWSMVLRQGPWWTEPIVISPRLGSCAPGAGLRCSPCPFLLCFFHGALPPAMCSSASSRNGLGIQLRWGKASPCHGDCNGGVRATDGAFQVTGHGERRLEHNRCAGMARVQRHWPVLWCAWVSQCSSRHVG